ncbi:hypothetical protein PHMEG_00038400 [Phytophthora megakarya]|uniref:Uncharacterized protein n=1 Tax=Phytophthora megakarya TaxID=4795 RepID=A0A225UHI1_9STRA|nr:hypothetical protein PHMEG_00038400 [Phytophthora megakarya]
MNFGLDTFRFEKEQKCTPWILALRAFLEDRALPLDGQLRVRVLQVTLHYEMKNDLLMRKVHLKSRAGPARTALVPVISLPVIETTIDNVCKHAYWPGKKRDVIEYRVPVYDLSGTFSLVVVDAIGPLETTPRDNKYILAFTDYFTRWVEAFPVKRHGTVTFVNLMVDEVVSRRSTRTLAQ